MKLTSAYANKLLKQLAEEKAYWVNRENSSCVYTVAVGETAVVPEYDFAEVAGRITEIDKKTSAIKHAINLANVNGRVKVGEEELSIDTILVAMAQLNKRKAVLDEMRKRQPKARCNSGYYASRTAAPEYEYINYDLTLVKEEYERVSTEIMEMQMALDRYNQTFEFEAAV